jgi:protein-L-isoaspartate(D-aspartate) O-methyltransferase
MDTVQDHRSFYAQFIVKSVGSSNERLIAAFSRVPREKHLGRGPWPVFVGSGYLSTISDDPRLVYHDVLIGLDTDRKINNGQPSLHARCIAALDPQPGESVVHVGAGTGYYTAILADLVGPDATVTAFEIEPALAERAANALVPLGNVTVSAGSVTDAALPDVDLVYVNAGATHPLESWLDVLRVGGRLVFPLTPNEGFGCMLLITRRSEKSYAAKVVARVAFIPCIGARDDEASRSLTAALETQSINAVKSLRRGDPPDDTAWCVGAGWWLSKSDPL